MSTVDQTAAPAKPQHGIFCPICNTGVLYRIAVTDDGESLHCFNCETTGTVHATETWEPVRDADDAGGPAGFQLTSAQVAAKKEAGIDALTLTAPAAPASTAAPAAAVDEPHATHDVLPPDEAQQQQQQGSGNG